MRLTCCENWEQAHYSECLRPHMPRADSGPYVLFFVSKRVLRASARVFVTSWGKD